MANKVLLIIICTNDIFPAPPKKKERKKEIPHNIAYQYPKGMVEYFPIQGVRVVGFMNQIRYNK